MTLDGTANKLSPKKVTTYILPIALTLLLAACKDENSSIVGSQGAYQGSDPRGGEVIGSQGANKGASLNNQGDVVWSTNN